MSQDQYQRYLGFLEADPDNLNLICETVRLAPSLGYFQEAIELCDRGLALDNSHRELLSIKALSLLSNGEISEALALFERLHGGDQEDRVIKYNMAYCLALQGQPAQALQLLEDGLTHYDSIPQMAHLQIRMLYDLEELEQAIDLSKQVLEINPADGKVHELLSSLYIDESDFASAETHAALALQGNPNLALAHTSMGTAALSKQDDLRALQHFEQALELNQKNGRAWLGKAMTFMMQNKLPEAEQSFDAAIEYMPSHLGAYQALTWCYISQGNLQKAEQTVKKALEIDDTFSENHGTLAVLAVMQGQLSLAQTEAQLALRLDRASFSGNYARALIAQANGNADEADEIIDTILDSPDIVNNLSLRQFITQFRKQGQTIH
jgi:tetratricopeptide (TPR) repeat protein